MFTLLSFSRDFVYIYDGSQEVGKHSGIIVPETIQSTFSNMAIVFTSDHNETKKGFHVAIRFLQPGISTTNNCHKMIFIQI